jgi:hypothetical protein
MFLGAHRFDGDPADRRGADRTTSFCDRSMTAIAEVARLDAIAQAELIRRGDITAVEQAV